jgi:hypothetical protein
MLSKNRSYSTSSLTHILLPRIVNMVIGKHFNSQQILSTYRLIIILKLESLTNKQNVCPSEYFLIFRGGVANKAQHT